MDEALRQESEKLARSWMRHDAGWLRDYLVAGVEDPRLNLQSIFSRHFVVRALAGDRFQALIEQEYRFSAVMNWLSQFAQQLRDPEEPQLILHALSRGADNAEGIEIPQFIVQSFSQLPATADGLTVPNYIAILLSGAQFANGRAVLPDAGFNTFQTLWNAALSGFEQAPGGQAGTVGQARPSLLEPACGSANDYRFLEAYGVARRVDYTGLDLCAKNVENARALFPGVRFEVGNVFDIAAPDKGFDLCFVHDLFEHLSEKGIEQAVHEICRVTRQGICVGFFNMDEIRDHVVRPVDEYHWNTLSMARMNERLAAGGFAAQVLHIGTFLRKQIGCEQTHNPNAYTCNSLARSHGGFLSSPRSADLA